MNTVDVKSNTYINFGIENNYKDPKFKTGDHVRIYQTIEIFLQKFMPQNTVSLLKFLKVKKLLERFTKKNDKKISLYKMNYFPEPYSYSKNKIKVELDLSKYATKSDLKHATGVDISNLLKMLN